MTRLKYIDSHTGGEPTRVVIAGAPDLGSGSMEERKRCLAAEHDWLRRCLILEPRGSDWLVGCLLQPPVGPKSEAGVIFFNNTGYLGMCGHGLIGVVETLAHEKRIEVGTHQFETPAGPVSATLHEDGTVSITNVESFVYRKNVDVTLPGGRTVQGDIAYGGNWFFLAEEAKVQAGDLTRLWTRAKEIRHALDDQGITGAAGAVIDHIELFGPPSSAETADSRNFVLCPGGEYDRSPCGTGTSAKLACLAAKQLLAPGETWRQESIIGSVFTGTYQPASNGILPTIRGRAFVTGRSECLLDPRDDFRFGIETPQP